MFNYGLSVLCLIVVTLSFLAFGYWILTYSFLRKNKKGDLKFNKKDHLDITDCKNPSCVRCNLYSEVTQNARTRLKKFIDMNILYQRAYSRIEHSFSENTLQSGSTSREILGPRLKGPSQNPNVFRLKSLPSSPVFDNEEFAMDIDILKENFDIIFSDFCKIHDENCYGSWLQNDTPTGKWSVFHLVNQGKSVEQNTNICKNTFSIVNTLPSLMCNNVFGNVVFSVVEPETTISEHYGPTNVRVRCHLGIVMGLVTPTSCSLSISDGSRTWVRGECLVFDDSYSHGVRHKGSLLDGFRAVLIVDLWHPGVTDEEKVAIDYMFAPR
ncbi:hypothetical protein FSP39_017501 [Pinctada imbricata]|uniref:Aspartyl/asparaginy/proline hydroxylase domain-containing protein n=1 Tax=Pinctada imbricata TaxID=66713 RepID=A0AA88XFZ6_PINIB|nr:hypothetical protein FSP39_017501 [Pinctada imbricata]